MDEHALVPGLGPGRGHPADVGTRLRADGEELGPVPQDIGGVSGARQRRAHEVPPDAPKGLTAKEIPAQVKTVLDVLQCLRSVRSASFRDGDATVTRTETVIRDLQ